VSLRVALIFFGVLYIDKQSEEPIWPLLQQCKSFFFEWRRSMWGVMDMRVVGEFGCAGRMVGGFARARVCA